MHDRQTATINATKILTRREIAAALADPPVQLREPSLGSALSYRPQDRGTAGV